MIELKVIKAYFPTFDADHNEMLLVSHTKENYMPAKQIECYLKSEADKVIAELENKLRHANYKRCLAMAGKCECGKLIYQYKQRCGDADTETGLDYLMKRAGWYRKWQLRWLEIAEKFKEASK